MKKTNKEEKHYQCVTNMEKECENISNTILNLAEINKENLSYLSKRYNLNVVEENNKTFYCNDSDFEELLNDSRISIKYTNIKHVFAFDDEFHPIGFTYGDYLFTAKLTQNNISVFCKVYAVFNGCSIDEGIDLENIQKIKYK